MEQNVKKRFYSIAFVICIGLFLSNFPFAMFLNDLNIPPISKQTCLYSLSHHNNQVTSIIQLKHDCNNDTNIMYNCIITASLDANIILYNPLTFQPISKIPSLNLSITTIFELNNSYLAIAYSDNNIHLFSLLTNPPKYPFVVP